MLQGKLAQKAYEMLKNEFWRHNSNKEEKWDLSEDSGVDSKETPQPTLILKRNIQKMELWLNNRGWK